MTVLVFIRSPIDNTPEPQMVHDIDAAGRPILPGWQRGRIAGEAVTLTAAEAGLSLSDLAMRYPVWVGQSA